MRAAAAPGESLPVAPGGGSPPSRGNAASWHREDMAPRATSPVLVGRADQLAVLEAALGPSRHGGPSVVLLGGEAGGGKARPMSGVGAAGGAGGAGAGRAGRGAPPPPPLPCAPFTAVLREIVRDLGPDGVAALLPGGVTHDLARLLPEFGWAAGDVGDTW